MKLITARATMKRDLVEKLFGTREAARDTTRKILASRSGSPSALTFKAQGVVLRTERSMPIPSKGK